MNGAILAAGIVAAAGVLARAVTWVDLPGLPVSRLGMGQPGGKRQAGLAAQPIAFPGITSRLTCTQE